MGKLPWSFFFNICQPVQTSGPLLTRCSGAQACQQWPGDSASLGQFSTVAYNDTVGGVILTATGGTPVDGIYRQMLLTIMCAAQSDPYPTFTGEDPSSMTTSFSWNRAEACPQPTPRRLLRAMASRVWPPSTIAPRLSVRAMRAAASARPQIAFRIAHQPMSSRNSVDRPAA